MVTCSRSTDDGLGDVMGSKINPESPKQDVYTFILFFIFFIFQVVSATSIALPPRSATELAPTPSKLPSNKTTTGNNLSSFRRTVSSTPSPSKTITV